MTQPAASLNSLEKFEPPNPSMTWAMGGWGGRRTGGQATMASVGFLAQVLMSDMVEGKWQQQLQAQRQLRHRAIRHRAIWHRATWHRAMWHRAIRHRAIQHRTLWHRAIWHKAILIVRIDRPN